MKRLRSTQDVRTLENTRKHLKVPNMLSESTQFWGPHKIIYTYCEHWKRYAYKQLLWGVLLSRNIYKREPSIKRASFRKSKLKTASRLAYHPKRLPVRTLKEGILSGKQNCDLISPHNCGSCGMWWVTPCLSSSMRIINCCTTHQFEDNSMLLCSFTHYYSRVIGWMTTQTWPPVLRSCLYLAR